MWFAATAMMMKDGNDGGWMLMEQVKTDGKEWNGAIATGMIGSMRVSLCVCLFVCVLGNSKLVLWMVYFDRCCCCCRCCSLRIWNGPSRLTCSPFVPSSCVRDWSVWQNRFSSLPSFFPLSGHVSVFSVSRLCLSLWFCLSWSGVVTVLPLSLSLSLCVSLPFRQQTL